ncbi:MAG TPA: carboxylating nicotinate-nucleotide diphosphorylase [Candidatus Omnitrophota bacterium]|nr:carboxylating nicotinate-nucleotide diphosphorylase [Candidatus Omnitrophota bacterium]
MNNFSPPSIIATALREDAAKEDLTTRLLVPADQSVQAYIIVKEPAVLCGLQIARQVFQTLDKNIKFFSPCKDGDHVSSFTKIARIKGKARGILSGERTALNFLSYLSGIATKTNRFVQAVKPYKTLVMDTRKTTPTLRFLEREAVRCGGGVNHRDSLDEMIFVKDNHWKALEASGQTISEALCSLRKRTKKRIEIEVENLAQFKKVLEIQPDIILLDNMSVKEMREAVRLNRLKKKSHRPLLEASGGINLKNVRMAARTGVDRVSIGELTHSRKSIDVSLELERIEDEAF